MGIRGKKDVRTKVAVVGTGMAGLVTAYLLKNDSRDRFDVKVFESGERASLDSASISVIDPLTKEIDRVDVPMRAFTEGYYRNLKAMYDFLGVQYKVQPFTFSFARLSPKQHESQYFVHASNNHQLPPQRPAEINILTYLSELVFVLICHIWFSFACLYVPARSGEDDSCESFNQYLRRIRLPQYFVRYYLLPLMSAVTTCPHNDLLKFPAKDVVDYKRCITSGRQLVVSEGVGKVERQLSRGLDIQYTAFVRSVNPNSHGVKISWDDGRADGPVHDEIFDKVILAVPPNVVGSVFNPVAKDMAAFPTTKVDTVVHRDRNALPFFDGLKSHQPLLRSGSQHDVTQIIHLRTSACSSDAATEATHVQNSGVMVTSRPLQEISQSTIIHQASFTRVLRTPESRNIVNRIFDLEKPRSNDSEKPRWKNGDQGVFLVGAWCWDGMVLLEGCVVSAMRTASALGVDIPWYR